MVDTSGNNIINAVTSGSPVKVIYNYGVRVWPSSNYSYYISWTPSDVGGSFTMEGQSHYLRTYMGYYTWSTGIVDENAFTKTDVTTIETNTLSFSTRAFASCSSLTYVSASKCTYIGYAAFWSCNNITSAYFPSCNYIENYGLGRLYLLQSISLPKCEYIGNYGFYYDSSLTSIVIPKCSYIGDSAFYGCINMSTFSASNCTYIGSRVFSYCSSLYYVNLSKCPSIPSDTFKNLKNLNYVYLNCNYVGESAFQGCENLGYMNSTYYEPIQLGSSCSYIGSYAFKNCTKVPWIMFDGVTVINESTFDNCNNMSLVGCLKNPEVLNITYIGSYAFRSCSKLVFFSTYNEMILSNCSYIGQYAFYGCNSLGFNLTGSQHQELYLPVCEYIGQYAFYGCAFNEIYLSICPSIHLRAFDQCNSLKSIHFGSRCSILQGQMSASSLEEIRLAYSSVVQLTTSMAFYNAPRLTSIYVPILLLNQYKNDSMWSWYSTKLTTV